MSDPKFSQTPPAAPFAATTETQQQQQTMDDPRAERPMIHPDHFQFTKTG